MSYLFLTPPAPAPGTKNGKSSTTNAQALSAYLGALADTCTVDPNSGARVCTSGDTIAPSGAAAQAPVIAPLPSTGSAGHHHRVRSKCPPAPSCPPCPPCGSPITPPIVASPILGRPVATPIPAMPGGFAKYSQLANAARARMMQLEGLGDECQVYANGARVCNAPGPAPTPAPAPTRMAWRSNLAYPVWRGSPFAAPIPGTPTATPLVTTTLPAAPAAVAVPATAPATVPYTTSTVAPVDNTATPAAPVAIDPTTGLPYTTTDTTTSTFPSFDFSSIPSWAWYVLFAGGVYWLFFKRR